MKEMAIEKRHIKMLLLSADLFDIRIQFRKRENLRQILNFDSFDNIYYLCYEIAVKQQNIYVNFGELNPNESNPYEQE